MSNRALFTIFVGVATCAALAASAFRIRHASNAIHPVTVTYQYSVFQPSASASPKYTAYETRAIRSDGAFMNTNSVPTAAGAILTSRAITFGDKYVVVDPQTESVSTYKPWKPTVTATNQCGGQSGMSILGYRTEIVTKHEVSKDGRIEHHPKKWLAPDLNCLPLREELTEEEGRLVRVAVSIKLGEPSAEFFLVPSSYTERSPGEVAKEAARRSMGAVHAASPNPVLDKVYERQKLR